jgi:hypothetical protein
MEAVLEEDKTQDLNSLETQLATYKERAKDFDTITEEKLEEAAIFVGGCKAAEQWIEADRQAKVKPLNDEVRSINDAHNKIKGGFEASRKQVEEQVGAFKREQKRLSEEAQRKAIADAEREKREKEIKAEQERQRLAKLQEAMPETPTAAQQKQLAKAEERLTEAEIEAATVAPAQVVEQVSNTIKTGAGSVTFGDDKKEWVLPGWDKKKKYRAMDVVDGKVLASLPAEIAWLLKVSVLDVPALNQSFKNRDKFPKPFGETEVFGGTTVRNGRAS